MKILSFLIMLCAPAALAAPQGCASNVDNLKLFHINGMFTPYPEYEANLIALEKMQSTYLNGQFEPASGGVAGAWNEAEFVVFQIAEVIRQKLEDEAHSSARDNVSEYLWSLLSGDPVQIKEEFIDVYSEVLVAAFTAVDITISSEADYANMDLRLRSTLSECNRTVIVAHSQGNFYANELMSNLYVSYTFPGGWDLNKYDMLGLMSVANPSSSVGGAVAEVRQHLINHITNRDDLIMAAVRIVVGAVDANYDSGDLVGNGHGLSKDYIDLTNQRSAIVSGIASSAQNMNPLPTYNHMPISSSAINSFGGSEVSNVLDIEFNWGGAYRYFKVPKKAITDMRAASSKGVYFNQSIKGVFDYEKL